MNFVIYLLNGVNYREYLSIGLVLGGIILGITLLEIISKKLHELNL